VTECGSAASLTFAFGKMKTIASLEIGRAREVLELLKREAIPAEVRTLTQENGLEISANHERVAH